MVAGMVLAVPHGLKAEVATGTTADSPKSVLEDEVIPLTADLCIWLADILRMF